MPAKSIVTATEKLCTRCGQIKQAAEFNVSPLHQGGLASRCKSCQAEQATERRARYGVSQPHIQRTEKRCPKCKTTKSIAECDKCRTSPDGHSGWCSLCKYSDQKQHREASPEYAATKQRQAEKIALNEQGLLRCRQCGVVKPFGEFSPNKKTKSGACSPCRSCKNQKQRLPECRKYGREYKKKERRKSIAPRLWRYSMKIQDYQEMLNGQDGCCAICQKAFTTPKMTHVDHDHATRLVRAILCQRCNLTLGVLGENINLCHRFIDYIVFHKANPSKFVVRASAKSKWPVTS